MRSALLFLLTLTLPVYAGEFDVRPAPAWVEHLDVDTRIDVAKQNVRWGIYDILDDHQVRAGQVRAGQVRAGHGEEWQYFRTVRKVLSPSGVQNASELELDFDPSFERLVIHDVSIVRNGTRLDALDADEVRVIDKEDDAESRIYDGERTALIFIKDVRPGDVIDYAWSLDGANPILGGRYTDEYDLSAGVPKRRMRHRLLWPAGTPLNWRGADPDITLAGSEQVFTWNLADVPPIDVEDSLPSWYDPWKSVQLTAFASWREVATWADAMFQLDARSTAAVKQLADSIRGSHATRDARITAAIRFVQDDIRYLGIEMGANSHQPHQPWETLDSRWGDCKDKTLLLVALLRELGLRAYPALVNTRLQHTLEEKLPSPFLFDHVIAHVVDGGKSYWIDGTISDQGGALATLDTPDYGSVLIVRPETHALTRMAVTPRSSTVVEQIYTTRDFSQPTELTVRTTYSGGDADSIRGTLATWSLEDFAHDRINDLAVDQPKIQADGRPHVSDDRAGNVIVIKEKYRIPRLWEDGHWTWYPRVLDAHLTRPDTMIRDMPIAFEYPLDVRQTVTFDFPDDYAVEKSSTVTETSTFRHEYTIDSNGKTVTIRQSLRALRDSVDAKDVADHLTKLNGIWSEIGYRLSPGGATDSTPAVAAQSPAVKWGLGLFFVATFVGIAVTLATRRRRPMVPQIDFRPGEAPASALAVQGVQEIDAHLASLSCTCGSGSYSSSDVQRALYAEREMTIVTRQCGTCGREQSVYFTAA